MVGLEKKSKKNKAQNFTGCIEKGIKGAWKNPKTSAALKPLSQVYIGGAKIRERLMKPYKAGVPVLCIGNLTVGGNGKTPLAMKTGKILKEMGSNPYFLTRGYKGELDTVVVSSKFAYTAKQVGDEPLLLAGVAPVVVDSDRARGAELVEKKGADAIIMDDGFQNPSLAKDKSILVFDGAAGVENGNVLPAGPLREPLEWGLARADAVAIIGKDTSGIEEKLLKIRKDIPVFKGTLVPEEAMVESLKGKELLALSAIGRPEKFVATLEDAGLNVKEQVIFSDHHFFTDEEFNMVLDRAKKSGLLIVTTEKDAVKLPPVFRQYVRVVSVTLEFEGGDDGLRDFLKVFIGKQDDK